MIPSGKYCHEEGIVFNKCCNDLDFGGTCKKYDKILKVTWIYIKGIPVIDKTFKCSQCLAQSKKEDRDFNLSQCPYCFCMTKTINGKCGKCKKSKKEEK